jgi:putative membrane protein
VTPPEGRSVETQPERTALAWQRTGLGVLAVAGLVAHTAVERQDRVLLVVAGAGALLGLGVLGGLAPVRYRQVRRRRAADATMSAPGLITAVTVAVALIALAAAAAVVTLR